MSTAELGRGVITRPSPSFPRRVISFLRKHPLTGYFLLAYSSWLWPVPTFALSHKALAIVGPWMLLAPISAAIVMAWITDGRAGLVDLLRRTVRWRVGLGWYAVALLTIPVLLLLGILAQPGGLGALRMPGWSIASVLLGNFAFNFFGAGLVEEPGWRGYALPRLQRHHGPLVGTLILGSLWAFWHLPLFVFLPGHTGARPGFLGTAIPFLYWAPMMVAFSVLITWVLNNSRGSVLMAMLFHASNNLSYDSLQTAFFPTLLPRQVAAQAAWPPVTEAVIVLAAILVIAFTRGRLGYDRYLREVSS